MNKTASEIIRKKYRYRRMILEGKIPLPLKAAAKLIGPDCAYHLYWQFNTKKSERRK